MSQGQHVGKNVLRMPSPPARNGTVLITGASGVLAQLVARHLVAEHGARRLVLVSRQGARAPGAGELAEELSLLGAEVKLAACDVCDREQLERLLESIPQQHPLDAVVHAAGVMDDGVIGSLTAEQLDRVLAPKVGGAWNLHELTRHMDLAAFVLFSSIAGVVGAPAQANYAAANAFLDALAMHRQSEGLAATSIAWGLWEQASDMTAHLQELDLARMRRMGSLPLTSEQGLRTLDAALALNEPCVVSARLDRQALRSAAGAGVLHPMLGGIVRAPARQAASTRRGSLLRLLSDVPPERHAATVLELVRLHAAHVLGHSTVAAIGERRPFKELGFDSLAAVELRNRLEQATGLRLPATLVFDYPNAAVVAGFLLEEAMRGAKPGEASLDGELAELERALLALEDDEKRLHASTRLRSLLDRIEESARPDAGATIAERIEQASDEEIFGFIDAELSVE